LLLPLNDQELESWDRWSKRKIDWKPEDVQRLILTIQQLKSAHAVAWVKHGTSLYQKTVALRLEVLRKPLGRSFTDEELAAEDQDHHLAVVDGDEVSACLILTELEGAKVRMRQVAVQPVLQRSGIGSALVRYSEIFAKRLDCKELILHARANVVPFYERLGYEVVGEEFEEVGIPHHHMRKSL